MEIFDIWDPEGLVRSSVERGVPSGAAVEMLNGASRQRGARFSWLTRAETALDMTFLAFYTWKNHLRSKTLSEVINPEHQWVTVSPKPFFVCVF